MADKIEPSGKRWGLRKKLAVGFGGVVLLAAGLYAFATSAMFVKSFVLPKVGSALNAKISVEDVSVSPFSAVSLRGLKVETTGEPLLQAKSAQVRYSLFDIIGGKINVSELTVEEPALAVVQNADGTSNLDPILKAIEASQGEPSPAPSETTAPPQLDLRNIALKNANARFAQSFKDGSSQSIELASVNLTVDQVKNGISGKMNLSSDVNFEKKTTNPAAHDLIKTKATAAYEFMLTADLKPQSLKGNARLEIGQTQGAFNDFAGMSAVLENELTPTEIKQFAVKFVKSGNALANITVSGPFDATKTEGNLKAEIQNLDRQVLNLVGAAMGMDFGPTVVNATSQIGIAQGGKAISASGKLGAKQFSVKQKEGTTAPLDLNLDYSVKVNLADSSARVETLALSGTQRQRQVVSVSVSKPMSISWAKGEAQAGEEAALDVVVNGLDLADWKPFTAGAVGKVNLNLNVQSQKAGKAITARVNARLENFGTDPAQLANLSVQTEATASDLSVFQVKDLNLAYDQKNAASVKLGGGAKFNKAANEGEFNLSLQAVLPENKAVSLKTAGKGRFDLAKSGIQADFKIEDLQMRDASGPMNAQPLAAHFVVDTALDKQVLDLKKVQLTLSETKRAKNVLQITGRVDMSKPQAISGNVKIAAEALDVTPYYDIFSSASTATTTPAKPATKPAPKPAPPTTPPTEPDAMTLPLRDFVVDVNVGRFYVREVVLNNWAAITKIDGGKVALDPFKVTFNGAPIVAKANLDLGVRGYQYDLTASMDKLPIEPLVNTFSPANAGKVKGDLFFNAQIKGAGVTGPNLRKNLNGQTSLNLTNANMQIIEGWPKLIITPIALVLGLPEMLKSPLDFVVADVRLGGGNIEVKRFVAQSAMMRAMSTGVIPIADVVTDSPLNQPLEVALPGEVAKKFKLSGQSPAAGYMELPTFVQIKGTLGTPEVKTDKLAILGVGVIGVGGRVTGEAGEIIRGVGGLLSGGKSETKDSKSNTETNKSGTKLNPFNLFKKKKQ
ncbi:MAG: AsmA family protein [Verrucomicrobiota bacterium]